VSTATPRRSGSSVEGVAWFAGRFQAVQANVEEVIRGKAGVVQLALTCLFSEGHLLLEDVPGVGKTSLARAMAASIEGSWNRIQFTPDLLPSDVTGVSIFDQKTQEFVFHPGAVFANIVVGDEINRASPKTQSALLEVMEERQVTVDGVPYPVNRPFMVIATQNPIDMDGTYRLPEAQMDRFLMRSGIGYPDLDAEIEVLAAQRGGKTAIERLLPVITVDEARLLIAVANDVYVAAAIHHYIASVVQATRGVDGVRLGASPRGSVGLLRAARARAASLAREYVVPEDVQALAEPVLAHRIIVRPEADLRGLTGADVVRTALESVAVPQQRAGT
jgi:MoxR-like ATPase